MNNRFRLYWTILLLFCVVNSFFSLLAQNTGITDKAIMKIAGEEAPHFLNDIPLGQEPLYGFENRDQFKSVTIGKPIQIISPVTETFPPNYDKTDVKLKLHDEWFVPLIVQNVIKALITVTKHEGRYQSVDFGAKDFATELNSFKELTGKKVYKISILRVYRLQSDFLVISSGGKAGNQKVFIPMTSARLAFFNGVKSKERMTENETMQMIREKLVLLSIEEKNR